MKVNGRELPWRKLFVDGCGRRGNFAWNSSRNDVVTTHSGNATVAWFRLNLDRLRPDMSTQISSHFHLPLWTRSQDPGTVSPKASDLTAPVSTILLQAEVVRN